MRRLHFFTLIILCTGYVYPQSPLTTHTLGLDHPDNAAPATIDDFTWLTGRWEGSGFGGITEETWNPPLGGTMVGTFRLVTDQGPSFYEMLLLVPEGNSISYKVKHFHPDFTGWEEKDEHVSFPLVRLTGDAAYFHGLTLQRDGDRCIHYLAMRQQDGLFLETRLDYLRQTYAVTDVRKSIDEIVPPVQQIPVMLLASYHMGNPQADMYNLKADDVLAPKRQDEIQAVVDRLAEWHPTKIAIESPFGDSATIAEYHAYLHGDRLLRRSEDEQIGYRLAKQLGHETVYPIDLQSNMDMASLGRVIASDPERFGPYMAMVQELGPKIISLMDSWLSNGSIGSMLYKMNDPYIIEKSLSLYFHAFVPVVSGKDYAGADLVADWYKRNLRTVSNLHQISDRADDRILIIFGQGHIPLFKHFLEESPYFRVEDVQEYLRGL
jgi:hypothetical protein